MRNISAAWLPALSLLIPALMSHAEVLPPSPRGRCPRPTIDLPRSVRALSEEAFDARCGVHRLRLPNTTAIAWFERVDTSALGIVLRDHMAMAFVAITLRQDTDDALTVDFERTGVPDRPVAAALVIDALDNY